MIQSFADATTADLWAERNTKAARSVPRDIWPVVPAENMQAMMNATWEYGRKQGNRETGK